jgi:hypothetical protein
MNMNLPKNLEIMLMRMRRQRDYNKNYQAQPKCKRKRCNLKFAKMKEGLKKQMADKAMGLNYSTGSNMEDTREQNPRKKRVICKFCGAFTHKSKRSKECAYFGWSDERVRDEMVRMNILM